MSRSVIVLPTGTANLASVLAAFRRLDTKAVIAREPADVAGANHVVVPGVGSFGAAGAALDVAGMRESLTERVDAGRPTLAICVGMQLLAAWSEESPHEAGLGLIDARVGRFRPGLRIPQLGWNEVTATGGCRFLRDGWAYFANSYRLTAIPDGWAGATTSYDTKFVSGMERGEVLACQFHPELSGPWGSDLLGRWLGVGA